MSRCHILNVQLILSSSLLVVCCHYDRESPLFLVFQELEEIALLCREY